MITVTGASFARMLLIHIKRCSLYRVIRLLEPAGTRWEKIVEENSLQEHFEMLVLEGAVQL